MATAEEDSGNSCGYVEEVNTAGAVTLHKPRKSGDTTGTAIAGVVVSRKYCVLKSGHAGGHSYRTQ